MVQCVGYGKYRNNCPNCAGENGNLLFCQWCAALKEEEIRKKKNAQKEAQEHTEKIIRERE